MFSQFYVVLLALVAAVSALPLRDLGLYAHERRQIGVRVLGFSTISGDATGAFGVAVASETAANGAVASPSGASSCGPAETVTVTVTATAWATSTPTSYSSKGTSMVESTTSMPQATATVTTSAGNSTSTSSGGSGSGSGGSGTGHSGQDLLSFIEDLVALISKIAGKAEDADSAAGGLGLGDASDLLSQIVSDVTDTAALIKDKGNLINANGDFNITALAEDAIVILTDVSTVVQIITSNPVTAVALGPEAEAIDLGLTALIAGLQVFVDVEPEIEKLVKGNATLEDTLKQLGGAVLTELGI